MKKIICILFLCFLTSQSFAAPRSYYYCGSGGYCFLINEWTNSDGSFGYSVSYVGMCSGGPFVYNILLLSPQDPATQNSPEGNSSVYTTFSAVPGGSYTPTASDISEAEAYLSHNSAVWVNPEKVNWSYVQAFATNNNTSIFALTVNGNPVHGILSFDLWSLNDQNVRVSLVNTMTGATDWSSPVALKAGKNLERNISVGPLTGSYSLQITSSNNMMTRNVILY